MSDSLTLLNSFFTHGKVDIPRYYDLQQKCKHSDEKEHVETAEEIISRFDRLRRKS